MVTMNNKFMMVVLLIALVGIVATACGVKPVEVAKTPMSESGKDALRAGKNGQELDKGQKGSFWSRLFGKKKVKKETDPN